MKTEIKKVMIQVEDIDLVMANLKRALSGEMVFNGGGGFVVGTEWPDEITASGDFIVITGHSQLVSLYTGIVCHPEICWSDESIFEDVLGIWNGGKI